MIGTSFLTVMFAELAAGGDDDAARRAHFAALRTAIAAHEGREIKPVGDGLMVTFGSAIGAVRCAIAMQRDALAAGRALQIGLDAGEPRTEGDDIYGGPVTVASRLCDLAAAGEILVSDVVRQIASARIDEPIHPRGSMRLRGVQHPVVVAEVAWADGPTPDHDDTAGAGDPITVVIADDLQLLRAGFRVVLEAEPDITVVGEAGDGRTAVDIVLRRRPDVVLMDIRMPELNGLEAAQRILSEPGSTTAVLMLTTFDLNEYVYEALRIGASGFLLKDGPADRLLDAVRVAAGGDALLAPSITRRLIGHFAQAAHLPPGTVPDALSDLTARELEILRALTRGLSNSEIAAELVLTENTVKTHIARVLSKLGLRDRVQAIILAYETGFVSPGPQDRQRP